jgi:hypothetical protein
MFISITFGFAVGLLRGSDFRSGMMLRETKVAVHDRFMMEYKSKYLQQHWYNPLYFDFLPAIDTRILLHILSTPPHSPSTAFTL